jgi:hypothetical protein
MTIDPVKDQKRLTGRDSAPPIHSRDVVDVRVPLRRPICMKDADAGSKTSLADSSSPWAHVLGPSKTVTGPGSPDGFEGWSNAVGVLSREARSPLALVFVACRANLSMVRLSG